MQSRYATGIPATCRRRFTSRIRDVLPKRRGASIRMFWPPRSSRSNTSRSASRSVNASPETIRPKRNGLLGGDFTRAGITQISITRLRRPAYSGRVRAGRSGRALQRPAGRIVPREQGSPVDAGMAGAKVGQGEAVAGGFRRGLAAAHLAQVPVIELVAIDEAPHLPPGAKPNPAAEPLKGEPAPRLAAGPRVNPPPPRPGGLPGLGGAQTGLAPAESRPVGSPPVAQRSGRHGLAPR